MSERTLEEYKADMEKGYEHTFDWDEHPDGYDDICYCKDCRDYDAN
ncbi:MAG: hypothetical protein KAR40_09580 [Candidatus Sabulitectum sp.]|nr:hypothetical protein [Candidatus Sabulitectum sp.]